MDSQGWAGRAGMTAGKEAWPWVHVVAAMVWDLEEVVLAQFILIYLLMVAAAVAVGMHCQAVAGVFH